MRVLLVDGDNMGSQLLAGALKRGLRNCDVRTIVGTSEEVLKGLEQVKPHVAVVSIDLQEGPGSGFTVLQRMRQTHPSTAAIMLFRSCESSSVVNAFRSGARGVFYRQQLSGELSKCIRAVHRGRIWVSDRDLEFLVKALTYSRFQSAGIKTNVQLTRREEEVVCLVLQGLKNREIAQTLQVTEHSVRNYIYRVFEKFGVSSRSELIIYCHARRGNQADA